MTVQTQWVIGAQPDCDMVVDQPTVSGRHCRLSFHDGTYLLEDLHSTNGTFVNGTKLEKSRVVSVEDRITLGQNIAMPWPKLHRVAPNESATPRDSSGLPRTETLQGLVQAGWSNPILIIAAIGLVTTITFAGVRCLTQSSSGGPVALQAGSVEPIADGVTQQPGPAVPDLNLAASVADAEDSTSITTSAPPVVARPDNEEAAVYCIIVGDSEGRDRYRIGTACAVGPQTLLTNASVLVAAEKLATEFPKMYVVAPGNRQEYQVSRRLPHPEYSKAYRELVAIRVLLSRQVDGSETADSDGVTTEQISQARAKGEELSAVLVACDVGKLEIDGQLSHFRTIADPASAPERELQLLGLPYATESLLFTPETTIAVRTVSVRNVVETSASTPAISWTFQGAFAPEQMTLAWTGSPIINDDGEVVLLFVRPTSGPTNSTRDVNASRFTAAFAWRLREF